MSGEKHSLILLLSLLPQFPQMISFLSSCFLPDAIFSNSAEKKCVYGFHTLPVNIQFDIILHISTLPKSIAASLSFVVFFYSWARNQKIQIVYFPIKIQTLSMDVSMCMWMAFSIYLINFSNIKVYVYVHIVLLKECQ